MNVQIEYENGHVMVYDQSGEFLFSADTELEAWQELNA